MGGVPGHGALHQGVELRRDGGDHLAGMGDVAGAHALQHLRDGGGLDRRSVAEQLPQQGPEGVDVGAAVERGPGGGLLGGHVGGRARDLADRGAAVAHVGGEPPVDDEHLAVVADHHVVGLEVEVEDVGVVGEGHRLAHPLEHVEAVRQAGHAVGVEELVQGAPLDPLHREEGLAVRRLADVVDRHHPGMGEAGREAGLLHEALAGAAGGEGEDLDGHAAAQVDVVGLQHLSHAAAAELAGDEVAAGLVGGPLGGPPGGKGLPGLGGGGGAGEDATTPVLEVDRPTCGGARR